MAAWAYSLFAVGMIAAWAAPFAVLALLGFR